MVRWFASKREKGCLPATLRHYRWAVRHATALLRQAARPTDPRQWSEEDARWLRHRLRDDVWQLNVLADLARFSRNLVFNEVGLPRRGPPIRVRWLTEAQERALIQVTRKDRFLRLVVLLGLGQGLRRIEWIRLRVSDVDLAGRRLLVRGKGVGGAKKVWMPLHPALGPAFQDFLEWRDLRISRWLRAFPLLPVPDELLIHRKGERLVPYGDGGANGWMSILERRLAAIGVPIKLSTHMLRRSGATLLEKTLLRSPEAARDGVYRAVQGFLRHESIATTMRYLEADPGRQAAAMEAFASALPWGVDPPDGNDPEGPAQLAMDRPAQRGTPAQKPRTAGGKDRGHTSFRLRRRNQAL